MKQVDTFCDAPGNPPSLNLTQKTIFDKINTQQFSADNAALHSDAPRLQGRASRELRLIFRDVPFDPA
jgi:hypothetical protein